MAFYSKKRRQNAAKRGPKTPKSVSVWKLFRFADRMDVCLMVLGTAGAFADGVSMPILMLIMSRLLNNIGAGPSANFFIHNINKYVLLIIYFGVGIAVAAFLEGFCWRRSGDRQASRMRKRYLKAVLRQDVGFFDMRDNTTSDVVNSVSNDTLVIQDVLCEKIPSFIMNSTFFVSNYIVAFFVAWRLAIVAFPCGLLMLAPAIIYQKYLRKVSGKMKEAYSVAADTAQQALSSIRTVYSFVGEEKTLITFSQQLGVVLKLAIKQGLMKGMVMGSMGMTFCIWSFVSWYGSKLVMHQGIGGGNVFVTGVNLIMGGLALGNVIPTLRYFAEAGVAAKRIFDMVDRVPNIDSENSKGVILANVKGQIVFRNVDFAYPSRPDSKIFSNFSLQIPAGNTVALVGSSGSGKSTAVGLIERFYDPLSGEVLLDGMNIKSLNLKWLRSQIGLVSQEPALFATSIKENILFGKDGATMDEVKAAASIANAHNFIIQLPNGYDTQVGESGAQMSGGQKQRIAIARAILKNPPLLLLDEATSALDAESERIVQEALDHASIGRTTVIVAHRLSTVRNAHTIAVIQEGNIMEMGSHDQLLMKQNGEYSKLIQLQQAQASSSSSSSSDNQVTRTAMQDMFSLRNRSLRKSLRSLSYAGRSSSIHSFDIEIKSLGLSSDDEEENYIPSHSSADAPSFWRMLALNAPEWKDAIMGLLGAICSGGVQPVYAYILGSTISIFFIQDHHELKSKIKIFSLVFFGLGVATMLVNVLQHWKFSAMGEHLIKRVRHKMLSKILTFEVGWFDKEENSSGTICSRLATEANIVRSLVGDKLSLIFQTASAIAIAYTLGIFIAWRMALVVIAVQPLIVACFYLKKTIMATMSRKTRRAQEKGSQVASEAVMNHRTITAFSSQDKILDLFEETQIGPDRDSMYQAWVAGLILAASQFVHMGSTALSFWYGGQLIYKHLITNKQFFQTFFILMNNGRVIADAAVAVTMDIAKGGGAVKEVFSIIDRPTDIPPEDSDGIKPRKIQGHIEARNIEFAYPSRPDINVLRDFSLRVAAGSTMALVGQSGSGKSTIISLIERFYDPLRGSLLIDGKDLRSFNLRFLRAHIALVGQEPTLFSGSVKDNILYGNDKASEADVIKAAKAANAHDFVVGLQDGYDTECGNRGVQLSGGQKQRIAIARSIIKNPSILLLDEATSALDTQSEKLVQEALDRIMLDRTTILIAHRLSTVQNAQCIAVVDKGKVVEQGHHGFLFSKGPGHPYYNLVHLQNRYQQS